MKIRTQFRITLAIFTAVLIVLAASVVLTAQHTETTRYQETLANNIALASGDLSYLSNDYVIYRESQQLSRWYAKYNSLSNDVSSLTADTPEQRALLSNIQASEQRIKEVFDSIVSSIGLTGQNETLTAFEVSWSRMAIQSQGLTSDASQLSKLLREDVTQSTFITTTLMFVMVGIFGAFLISMYFQTFRRTLKSMTTLQTGTNIIGSGNLDFTIKEETDDEIGELTRNFNQMTVSLKNVTSSKKELEKEISERKKAEELLRSSEERFSKAFHTSPSAMTISRIPEGTWVDVNESFLRLTEYSREEIIGHNPTELRMFDHETKERTQVFDILSKQGSVSNIELGARSKSGKPLRLLYSGVIINLNGESHAVSMQIDITERKRAEEELRKTTEIARKRARELEELQIKLEEKAAEIEEFANKMEELATERARRLKEAERLAAIGATAGMVGHDIRNPLQSILSELYLAKGELQRIKQAGPRTNLSESLTNIENDIYYINKIVQDLQDFAKPLKPVTKEADLEVTCNEILTKTGVPDNIVVTCKVDENTKKVTSDPDLLKRIISNLVINAVQAMPNGGKLSVHVYEEQCKTMIAVQDTGLGIPEEVKPKLFTPLFTTKSKGQGFGLAVVKRMTESLGGTVAFDSEIGKGTTFLIQLPK